jgi:hypothetical protein
LKDIYKNKFFFISALLFILSISCFLVTFKTTISPILGQFSPWYIIQLGHKPEPWHFYKLTFILTLALSIIGFVKAKKNIKLNIS